MPSKRQVNEHGRFIRAAMPCWIAAFACLGVMEPLPAGEGDRQEQAVKAAAFSERLAELVAIHPAQRTEPGPTGGKKVAVNPPPLLWPPQSSSQARYAVRLSQDPAFRQSGTIAAEGLRWALFNPHQKLAAGTWHWQYGVASRPGEEPRWSEAQQFRVDDSARLFVTPPAKDLIAACPKEHPRILIEPNALAAFRKRVANVPEAEQIARSAARYLGRDLPEESKGKPTQKGADEFESKNFAKWASKDYAADLAGATSFLATAYLITGDAEIGREAARRAVFVARLDPEGVTSRSVSDFADGSCMRAMALGYDCCYELLSEKERQELREAMNFRGSRFFSRLMNNLEAQVFNAHVWQHILMDGTDLALATLGEIPEAETWLAYAYELWIARFPLLGGDDGGWANGLSYFSSNFNTLLGMPALFERLTGADFLDHPWYRSAIYYQLYCWPPGSASDGFGDGSERESKPSSSRGEFLAALGRRFGDPHALWYARQILGDEAVKNPSPLEAIRRQPSPRPGEPPLPQAPAGLPTARLFRDVGVVSMHTDLCDASRDLMIGFRCSPYGSYNHMHSNQNSFSVLAGGRRLFEGSGYYIAYGDDHFQGWYTASRGHNTVLVDGRGQVRGPDGFGVVSRFLHGRRISYALGDASRAYGDAGLTTFRRQLALLRPGTIVVYDELAADHAAHWSWLLHSKERISVEGRNRLRAAIDSGRAVVDLWASAPLELSVDTEFDPPAVNWRKRSSGNEVVEYPDQWHATAGSVEPAPKLRILAVFQVHLAGEGAAAKPSGAAFDEPAVESTGCFRVGPWRIEAELDASKEASLLVTSADGRTVLAADRTSVTAAGKNYALPPLTSLLVEDEEGIVAECRDELPAAAQ